MAAREVRVKWGLPNGKQAIFLRDKHKYSAYGGARGGGKSWVVRLKAISYAVKWPGIKVLIVRRTYAELANNHIRPLKEMIIPLGVRYNDTDKIFTFPNGSTIKCGYCASDGDTMQYQGAEYDVIFLEEATQLREEWMQKISASMRGVNGLPKQVCYTCNPGGPGHAYIKRLFVDRKYQGAEKAEDYAFVQARVTDNVALMQMQPDYIDSLRNLAPKLRRAWLDGDWNVLEGQAFEEFRDDPEHYADRRYTHVIDPFTPPAGWQVYRSFDWGYRKPFSVGWYAVDYDGVIYRIMELYGCVKGEANTGIKWPDDQIFDAIRRIEGEHPWLKGRKITGVADPAIWDASKGPSTAEMAAKRGIYFDKGDHKRIAGWMQCHYRLRFDDEWYPQFYVFRNCAEFIRTVPILEYDSHVVEDIDTEGEDHIADEWRYAMMARPITPRKEPEKAETIWSDPLEQYSPRRQGAVRWG